MVTRNRPVIYGRWIPKYLLLFFLFFCLNPRIFGGIVEGQRLVPETDRKTIVLDPGHGGNDRGAVGPDGSYEKDVALAVAQKIAVRLKDKYRVILTRSGDYNPDIFSRTAVANHQKADLFISIHLGGDFLYKTDGVSIFTYQENARSNPVVPLESVENSGGSNTENRWDRVQIRHKSSSKQLAKAIYDRLCSSQHTSPCKLNQAPLLVLMGADMPAILIELGYITHPQKEMMMNDAEKLSGMMTAIENGIDGFFASYHKAPLQ